MPSPAILFIHQALYAGNLCKWVYQSSGDGEMEPHMKAEVATR